MRRCALMLLLFLMALLSTSVALAIPVARLQLWSDPGDPIGRGVNYDITYGNNVDDLGLSRAMLIFSERRLL